MEVSCVTELQCAGQDKMDNQKKITRSVHR